MKKNMVSIIPLVFLLLGGLSFAADPDVESAHDDAQANVDSATGTTLTLRVPLWSELFSKTPVASVNDEPITVDDLLKSLATMHTGMSDRATSPEMDFESILNRIITMKLIVQEARNIGLDELPEVKDKIDTFSVQLLKKNLVSQHLKDVQADEEMVDKVYKQTAREFRMTTLLFEKEENALLFEKEYKSGKDFVDLARRFIEEKRAEGEIDAQEYLKLKDLRPAVASAASTMAIGSVSEIFRAENGFMLFRIEDARFYEDPTLKERAREQVLDRLRKEKAIEYGNFLIKKYAVIDERLLKKVNFEPRKSGFPGFRKEVPADYESFLKDQRVLATVKGDESFVITVADLTSKIESKFYHGAKSAFEQGKHLNEKKRVTLQNMLFSKCAQMEAASEGLDKTDAYLAVVQEFTESVLFGAFINKIIAPDVTLTEEEVQQYYEEHLGDYSTPKMLRMKALAFSALPDARSALDKLKKAADFDWVSANSPGQVDKDTQGLLVFGRAPLSMDGLPSGLREAVQNAKEGDYLLYPEGDYYYVIAVEAVLPSRPEPYETIRGSIIKIISNEKLKELIADWSVKLREEYETRVFVTKIGG